MKSLLRRLTLGRAIKGSGLRAAMLCVGQCPLEEEHLYRVVALEE